MPHQKTNSSISTCNGILVQNFIAIRQKKYVDFMIFQSPKKMPNPIIANTLNSKLSLQYSKLVNLKMTIVQYIF